MSLKSILLAGACATAAFSLPTLATAEMTVTDPYARSAGAMARSGAAFMAITNGGETDDRLVAVLSDVAERVELHTHITDGDVMRMVELENGIELPAGETVTLQRGGLHVMFLGLTRALETGDEAEITLSFEGADDMTLTIPVDNARMPSGHGGHGSDS